MSGSNLITLNDSFSITIAVRGTGSGGTIAIEDYQMSHYCSTLTVTGNFPGIYEYRPNNVLSTNVSVANFSIQGKECAFCVILSVVQH